MKVFPKLVPAVLFLLMSSSLWSMEQPKDNYYAQSIEDILIEIFRHLDLRDIFPNVSSVCKRWNRAADNELLLEPLSRIYFGDEAKDFKGENKTWKDVFQNHHIKIKHVLNMSNWKFDDAIYACSNEGFTDLEKHLLKNGERNIIFLSRSSIHSSRDFVAMVFGYYMISISVAGNVLDYVARDSTYTAVWDTAKDAFLQGVMCAVGNTADIVWFAATTAVWDAARDAVLDVTKQVFNSLMFKEKNNIDMSRWRLNHLFVLAYCSPKNIYCYYQKAFEAAQKELNADITFKKSKDEILAILAKYTWDKPVFTQNPYIITLRHITEGLSQYVKEDAKVEDMNLD